MRGEISGFRRAPTPPAICYFLLSRTRWLAKIEGGDLEGRVSAFRMRIKPAARLEASTASGRLTTYPGQSKYQIVVETLEPAGLGALMALLEERKKKARRRRPVRRRPSSSCCCSCPM